MPDDRAPALRGARSEDSWTSSAPGISVVVPVRNAARSLHECAESILGQDYPSERFEAIFVDNGSSDASVAVLAAYGPSIRVLQERKRGAAAARNAGIRAARNEFIACTDADCVANPLWLRRLTECAARNPAADIVGGAVKSHESGNSIARYSERFFDQGAAIRDKPPYAISGNVFARKAFLLKIGLFDESMLRGHDTDLSYRAGFEHGAQFAFAEDAIVFHRNPSSVGELFREGLKHGRGSAFILRKHGGRLATTPLDRALDLRRYRRIGRSLRSYASGLLPSAAERLGAAAGSEHLCEAVYNLGKQIGLLRQAAIGALQERAR